MVYPCNIYMIYNPKNMISKTLAGSGIKRDLATVSDEKRETPMETPKMVERPSGFDELNRKLRRLRVVKKKRPPNIQF